MNEKLVNPELEFLLNLGFKNEIELSGIDRIYLNEVFFIGKKLTKGHDYLEIRVHLGPAEKRKKEGFISRGDTLDLCISSSMNGIPDYMGDNLSIGKVVEVTKEYVEKYEEPIEKLRQQYA